MPRPDFSLDQLRIDSPCPADLDRMLGDDRRRFCTDCNLRVTNVSAMTRADAEAFLQNSEGRTCVQLSRRPDGRVLAADDPWRFRITAALKRRLTRFAAAIGIGAALMNFLGCYVTSGVIDTRPPDQAPENVRAAGMVAEPNLCPPPDAEAQPK